MNPTPQHLGCQADEVPRLRGERRALKTDPRFDKVVGLIRSGLFGWEEYFAPIMDAITTGGDYYLVANDFVPYIEAQAKVDSLYRDQAAWNRMSIMSAAGMGKFSTDRTIAEYAKDIWGVQPCVVPQPHA
ncbi:alpha-1,4 glucan phosphorylase, partial [Haematococcus lacustris]